MEPVYIGFLAGAMTTLSFLPQALQTYKTRRTDDLSLGLFSLMTAGVACWFVYGLMIDDLPMIIFNSLTFVMSGYIFFVKISNVRSGKDRKKEE